jgi:AraC-like DNA-binding protein
MQSAPGAVRLSGDADSGSISAAMFDEPTTLSSVARLIGETLEDRYDIDPEKIFSRLRIDSSEFSKPGARISFARMRKLWEASVQASGDRFFGIETGMRARPTDFYVLGHAWLASATLHGAFNRLCRYRHVISTAPGVDLLEPHEDGYVFSERLRPDDQRPPRVARDGGYAALFGLCDAVTHEPVRPLRVTLTVPEEQRSARYEELFRCPITYGGDREIWIYDGDAMREPLTGSVPEVADSIDRIAEQYISGLDAGAVSTSVRSLLVKMLPSGKTDQETIAGRLYRSTSTLQRQLNAEGTSYRDVLESTRRELAEQYLKEGTLSKAEIAFMVGFADQSNFARAFKRWTGMSPGEYQEVA